MDSEDHFSFPRTSDTCAYGNSIDSPPLWNISPKGSTNPYQVLREGSKGDEKDCFEAKVITKGQRKSFSCVQNGKKITGVGDEEVPMDLLWEVFNEELPSATEFATSYSRDMIEFGCASALTVAKNRPSMVVIVKILKKLFYLNNS